MTCFGHQIKVLREKASHALGIIPEIVVWAFASFFVSIENFSSRTSNAAFGGLVIISGA